MDKQLQLWTDGGCNNKNGLGAYAFVAVIAHTFVYQEAVAYKDTTSNRMEMRAAINALKWARENMPNLKVVLISDSKYLLNIPVWAVKWRQSGWLTSNSKPVKNKDLVMAFLTEVENSNGYTSEHVHGHSGVIWNEHADELATLASKEMEPIFDVKEISKQRGLFSADEAAEGGLF